MFEALPRVLLSNGPERLLQIGEVWLIDRGVTVSEAGEGVVHGRVVDEGVHDVGHGEAEEAGQVEGDDVDGPVRVAEIVPLLHVRILARGGPQAPRVIGQKALELQVSSEDVFVDIGLLRTLDALDGGGVFALSSDGGGGFVQTFAHKLVITFPADGIELFTRATVSAGFSSIIIRITSVNVCDLSLS